MDCLEFEIYTNNNILRFSLLRFILIIIYYNLFQIHGPYGKHNQTTQKHKKWLAVTHYRIGVCTLGWSKFSKLCNTNFGVVWKVGNMAETNFKIDIRWLTPKTCFLPQPRGRVKVKFHEFVINSTFSWDRKLISGLKHAEDTSFY